ncbi:MAG: hypothetical protein OXQ31_23420 [Spirochaetaceae bacterium]|nr:hypothetical protein [Spirochaetaceae bacterium]
MDQKAFGRRLNALVSRYRAQCLWDLKPDLDLQERDVAAMVLRRIASCADTSGFVEARGLLDWLSRTSNAGSAVS